MHKSSYDKMKQFIDKYLDKNKKLRILDIGSQDVNGTYRQLFENQNWDYIGADMEDGKNVDIILKNVYRWNNIKANSFDVIISGQAIEHIEFFWHTMYEINRILKPSGKVCIIGPSGGFEHRYPLDCWRFYPDGMKALATYSKLNILEAYTQWDNLSYDDGSDVWHDSVLIAEKPIFSLRNKISFFIKRELLYICLPGHLKS